MGDTDKRTREKKMGWNFETNVTGKKKKLLSTGCDVGSLTAECEVGTVQIGESTS